MSWDDMDALQNEDFAWPDVAEASAFRDAVEASVERFISSMASAVRGPRRHDQPGVGTLYGLRA